MVVALPFHVLGVIFGFFFPKTHASKYGATAGSGLSLAILSHFMRELNYSVTPIITWMPEVFGLIFMVNAIFLYWLARRQARIESAMAANVA